MGGCWENTYKDYASLELQGNFLFIIVKSDSHGSCAAVFAKRENIETWKEVILETGLSHGFIYKGYKAWIDQIVQWAN